MGSSQIQCFKDSLDFKDNQWEVEAFKSSYELVRNRITSMKAEQYLLHLEEEYKINDQMNIYNFRQSNTLNLVEIIGVKLLRTDEICYQPLVLKVLTEHIPHKLHSMKNVSEKKGLQILRQSLIGFKALYQSQGPFRIDLQMIGFNCKGQLKVWINSNLASNNLHAKNRLEKEYIKKHPKEDDSRQIDMILQIFQAVNLKVKTRLHQKLTKFRQRKIHTFFEAINYVEDHIESQNLILEDHFQQVKNDIFDFQKQIKKHNREKSKQLTQRMQDVNKNQSPIHSKDQNLNFEKNLSIRKTKPNISPLRFPLTLEKDQLVGSYSRTKLNTHNLEVRKQFQKSFFEPYMKDTSSRRIITFPIKSQQNNILPFEYYNSPFSIFVKSPYYSSSSLSHFSHKQTVFSDSKQSYRRGNRCDNKTSEKSPQLNCSKMKRT